MLKIRAVEHKDKEQLMVMAEAMHNESPRFKDRDFQPYKAEKMIEHLIIVGGGYVALQDGKIVGMIGGIIAEHFFGFDKYATDIAVYVDPDKRGSSIAIRLIKVLEDWAKSKGCIEVILGVSTGVHPEKTVSVYERLGYKMASYGLLKNIG